MKNLLMMVFALAFTACSGNSVSNAEPTKTVAAQPEMQIEVTDTATFAGGCFWCVEASFDQIRGVVEAVSGYAGGEEPNPTYNEVASGRTQYAESVQIYYNADQIDYETLLDIFFTAHDPTQLNRQGPDIGKQYRSVIFYHNNAQKQAAEKKMAELALSGEYEKEIVTGLNPYNGFHVAEDYHQDYEEMNPNNPYIQNVSKPKIDRVRERFKDRLKGE